MRLKLDRRPSSTRWMLVALLLYALLVAVLSARHECWRDEADVWLQSRDQSASELLRFTHYLGSPALWTLLQAPFAKLAPYWTLMLLHSALSIGAAAVFLLRAPFPPYLRVLFCAGYYMSYEYGVIARNYILIALFLFAFAALLPHYHRRPVIAGLLVALLANSHAHGFMMAGALTVVLFGEVIWGADDQPDRRRRLIAAAIALLGVLAAFWQLLPAPDAHFTKIIETVRPGALVQSVRNAFAPGLPRWTLPLGAGVLASGLLGLVARPRALAFFALSFTGLTYINVFKYSFGLRHYGTLLIAFIAALWIAELESEQEWWRRHLSLAWPGAELRRRSAALCRGLLAVSLTVSVVVALHSWHADFRHDYSQGYAMARYLREHGLTTRTIAAYPANTCASILPYIAGVRFWYPSAREFGTYMGWNRAYSQGSSVTLDEAIRRLKETFPSWDDPRRGVLLICGGRPPEVERAGFRLVYTTARERLAGRKDEWFSLYEPAGVGTGR